jgi:anthranilate/para-aminobenzoate synthase component I
VIGLLPQNPQLLRGSMRSNLVRPDVDRSDDERWDALVAVDLVSTVRGTLRADTDVIEALAACFPGGSITGAPKKRACEIIAELERHPRGLYTGAIGWFGFDGRSQWNIAIRTAVQRGGEIRFHTGCGIVADSVAEAEHEESLHKAAGLLQAAGQA